MRSWKYTFRPYSLFVFSLQLFMFPVLPSSYCLPIFFCPCFLKASFVLILAFLWVARVNKRSSSLGPVLSSHPCHISVLLWPQKHLPSLPVRPILTQMPFCYQFSILVLSWDVMTLSWLASGRMQKWHKVRSSLLRLPGPPFSICSLLRNGSQSLSWAGGLFFSCHHLAFLFVFLTISQHLVSPVLWNDPWATLLILVEVLPF